MKRKFLAVTPEIHADLKAIAKANGRTIIGQINYWLKTQPMYSGEPTPARFLK